MKKSVLKIFLQLLLDKLQRSESDYISLKKEYDELYLSTNFPDHNSEPSESDKSERISYLESQIKNLLDENTQLEYSKVSALSSSSSKIEQLESRVRVLLDENSRLDNLLLERDKKDTAVDEQCASKSTETDLSLKVKDILKEEKVFVEGEMYLDFTCIKSSYSLHMLTRTIAGHDSANAKNLCKSYSDSLNSSLNELGYNVDVYTSKSFITSSNKTLISMEVLVIEIYRLQTS